MLVLPSVGKVVKMESILPASYDESGTGDAILTGNLNQRQHVFNDDRLAEVALRLRVIGDQLDRDFFQGREVEFPGFIRCLLRTWRFSRQLSDSVDVLLNIYTSLFTNNMFVQRRNELRSYRPRRRAYSESEV